MKLTAKLILIFILGIIIVTSLYAFIEIRRIEEQFHRDTELLAKKIGTAMEERIEIVWRKHGEEGVLRMIQEDSGKEQRMRVRWTWFQPEIIKTKVVQRGASIVTVDAEGNRQLVYYRPIALDDHRSGRLELSRPLAELDKNKQWAIIKVLGFSTAMVLVSGAAVTLGGICFVGRPLKQLIEKTRRIGHGDLDGPLQLQSRDELGELAGSLNVMCQQLIASQERIQEEAVARLAAVNQLRHADRLRTVGRLASGLAHELGTPLNVVSGRASLIVSEKLSAEEVVSSAETIRAESERMSAIIRQLLNFARRSKPQPSTTDLRKMILGTLDLLKSIAEKSAVQLDFYCKEKEFPILFDVDQLQQVLSNLIVNAIQSMPTGGVVRVGLKKDSKVRCKDGVERTGPYYCLTVADEGVGISPENIEHVFEPFFTTKKVGEGTGLGLSISYGIIQEHGGWLDVHSELGQGSCFEVFLPMETEVCQDES